MEHEGSLPHSQVPATCLYPEPTQLSPSNLTSIFCCSGRTKVPGKVRDPASEYFVTQIRFHGEELLATRPTPKLDHPLSAVATAYAIYS
jgi:hypothetical protein